MLNSCCCYLEIFLIQLAADEVEALADCCLARAAAAHVWVKHRATRGRDEAAEVSHQRGWFHRWMVVAVTRGWSASSIVPSSLRSLSLYFLKPLTALVAVLLASLRAIEEAGS